MSGHIQNQLTKSLERILEDAHASGELKLSGRKLKEFPKASAKFNLSDTVIADLSKNRFSELPEEVTTYPFLERLHAYHNVIRSIPDTISGLQCLSHLDLSRNQLTKLPRELCQLPLQVLVVSNNRLRELPDELGRMPCLTELDASCNQLTHLPPHMSDLPHLKSLLLRSNLLLSLPVEVTYLRLVRLDIRANRIPTLPVELRLMKTLIDLFVDDNPLTSPPASLCRRGRVHIFKYLEIESIKQERKRGLIGEGGRRVRRSTPAGAGPPSHLPDRLRHKRHNVDSGYSTSDGFDKRWSQEVQSEPETGQQKWIRTESTPVPIRTVELNNGSHSGVSTPSTISPGDNVNLDEEMAKVNLHEALDKHRLDDLRTNKETNSARLSPGIEYILNGNGLEDKGRPLQQIQTYREYKEALRQQRAQDGPAIYRTKDTDDQNYKTEPCTPTHHVSPSHNTLATSKSDPTPLNAVLSSPKHIFDDTSPKRPVQKVTPSRNCNTFSPSHTSAIVNGNSVEYNGKNGTSKFIQDYVKPKSPVKASTGIMAHDNCPNGKPSSPRIVTATVGFVNGPTNGTLKNTNGVKTNRNISWNRDIPPDKLSFTMRREFDKAKEESDLIDQLRSIIETRLKMALPADLAPALTDGVVLCHLANHVKPRSVASIHVPSPAVPKLTMARCRRNVDNFLEACRKIGVEENLVCCAADVLEGRGLVQVAITVSELLRFQSPKSPLHAPNPVPALF
ncbi:Leucine-rich-repeats and calponin homology domain protein [Carabus blaptoides fortunei]